MNRLKSASTLAEAKSSSGIMSRRRSLLNLNEKCSPEIIFIVPFSSFLPTVGLLRDHFKALCLKLFNGYSIFHRSNLIYCSFSMAKWGEGDPRWIVEERADSHNVNNWHWKEVGKFTSFLIWYKVVLRCE